MEIIKEYPVKPDCDVAYGEGSKTYGPFTDAEAHLINMGAKEGDCSFANSEFERHGDWVFGHATGPDFVSGPYIIYPEGWSDEHDNPGLQLRIFSVQELRPPDDLKS